MAQSPSQPARFTLVFDFVGRESLSNANALNSIVTNMTQIVGPAIGGMMIAAFGVSVALCVSAAWFLVSFIALWPLRKEQTHSQPSQETLSELLTGGFRAVFSNRLATAVLLITFAANTLLWPIYAAFMPVFAKDRLGLDAEGLGWLLTCSGTGGLLGSLIIAALGDSGSRAESSSSEPRPGACCGPSSRCRLPCRCPSCSWPPSVWPPRPSG
jgi:predicted MFS family arabinose efflux permease